MKGSWEGGREGGREGWREGGRGMQHTINERTIHEQSHLKHIIQDTRKRIRQ